MKVLGRGARPFIACWSPFFLEPLENHWENEGFGARSALFRLFGDPFPSKPLKTLRKMKVLARGARLCFAFWGPLFLENLGNP